MNLTKKKTSSLHSVDYPIRLTSYGTGGDVKTDYSDTAMQVDYDDKK